MKKVLSWALAVVMVCTLCCVPALALDMEELAGSYKLTAMDDGSGTDYSEYLPLLDAMGMAITLEIYEDGTAELSMMGEIQPLEFRLDDMTVGMDDDFLPFTFEDGTLVIGSEGEYYMSFSKGDASPKRSLPFDYYVAESVPGDDASEEEAVLYVFSDGTGRLDLGELSMEAEFDFENMVVALEGQELEFTLEDDVLTIIGNGDEVAFRLSDPGWVGPYGIVDLKVPEGTDTQGFDLEALMDSMGALFRLEIDEDGVGVLDVMGTVITMKFDFDEMTVVSIDEDGTESEAIPFTYENGRITVEEEGAMLTFGRILAEEAVEEVEEEAAK